MQLLEKIGEWLQGVDFAIPGDMLVVPGGVDFEHRLAAALDLLQRGFAPRVLISLGTSKLEHRRLAEEAASSHPDKVRLIRHNAVSLWEEAVEVRSYLKKSGCASAVVVTSWYQARRVRLVFARTLRPERIAVHVCPVRAPRAAGGRESHDTKSAILLEPLRLFGAWLHRGLPPAQVPSEESDDERKAA